MKLEDCNISSTQILSLLPPSALCLSCLWSIVMFFSTHHLLCPFCFVCIVHFTFSPLTVHHPTCHLPSHNLDFFSALCSITLAPNLSSVGRHSDFSSSTFTFPCPSRLRVTLFFFFSCLTFGSYSSLSLPWFFLSLLPASLLSCVPPLRPLKSVFISWENVTSILTRKLLSCARRSVDQSTF